jgi:hypothetical protein
MNAKKLTENQLKILAIVAANPGCPIWTAAHELRRRPYSPNQASYNSVHRCLRNGWLMNSGEKHRASLTLTTAGEAALREGYDVLV